MAFALARHDAVRLFAQGGILMTGSLILSWHRGFISTGLLLLGVLVASRVSVTRTVIAFAVGLVVVGVGYLIAIELVPEIFGKILELKGSKGLKTERFEIWLGYLPIVLTHPFGVGITAASVLRTAAQYGMPHVPHNVYLNLALQIGFLGFAAFFMLVGPIVLRNARAWHLARDPRLRSVALLTAIPIAAFFLVGVSEPVCDNGHKINNLFWMAVRSESRSSLRVLQDVRARQAPERAADLTGAVPAIAPSQ